MTTEKKILIDLKQALTASPILVYPDLLPKFSFDPRSRTYPITIDQHHSGTNNLHRGLNETLRRIKQKYNLFVEKR